jgi:hypothetical protein
LLEHDLFGKPVSTFPDHAQSGQPATHSGNVRRQSSRLRIQKYDAAASHVFCFQHIDAVRGIAATLRAVVQLFGSITPFVFLISHSRFDRLGAFGFSVACTRTCTQCNSPTLSRDSFRREAIVLGLALLKQ